MEEDIKETIVVNKSDLSAEDPEETAKAAEETETLVADSIPDDIEHTLLLNEISDLTIPIPGMKQPEPETEDEPAAEASDPVPDDIEYTLMLHEVSDLTIPIPGMKQPEPEETDSASPTSEEPAEAAEEAAEEQAAETGFGLPEGHRDIGEITERIEARRRYNEIKNRRMRTRFYVILTILVLGIFFFIISFSSLFTVDSIEVKGNKHYTAEEIINMGHAVPGRNIIYDLNGQEIVDYLEQNPYIKNAEVKRKLPSTMVIKVKERTEKLAFRYDDDYLIMDGEGILLKKTRNEPKTTLVEGIVINKIKLGEKIGAEDSARLDKALDLLREMTAADLYFVKVDLSSEKKTKAYIYDTLIVKAKYDLLITNLKNGRLHLVVEKLFSDGIKRGTITFEEDGTASFMPII